MFIRSCITNIKLSNAAVRWSCAGGACNQYGGGGVTGGDGDPESDNIEISS